MSIIEDIRTKFETLIPYMDERLRRLWAGAEAVVLGKEGIKIVAFATGLSTKTIRSGIQELLVPLSQKMPEVVSISMPSKIRQPGGGRKSLLATDPTLIDDLKQLIAPATRGDPCSP
jgi:hypothetical protein